MVSVGVKSAVIAYVAAFVGVVAVPLYFTFATAPDTEPATVAPCGAPLYVTGELVTESVGVALLMTKLPAEAAVKLL